MDDDIVHNLSLFLPRFDWLICRVFRGGMMILLFSLLFYTAKPEAKSLLVAHQAKFAELL
jgi:hypothetical protein